MPVALLAVVVTLIVVGLVALRSSARARAAEQRLRRYRLALDRLPDAGFVVLDRSLRVELASGRGLAAFGLRPSALAGRRLRDAIEREAWTVLEPVLHSALAGDTSRLHLPSSGRDHALHVLPLSPVKGRVDGVLVALQDVTERRRRERSLSELASRDGLTGLWNRRRLERQLERLLAEGRTGVLLFADLDSFKVVNDTLGHDAGDDLLRRVARALEGSVRRSDLVARVGGDEFALLLPDMADREATLVADKIALAVRGVWPPGLQGGASVGYARVDGHSTPASTLAAADRAMYSLKRSARMAKAS